MVEKIRNLSPELKAIIINSIFNKSDIMYSKEGVNIRRITDNKNDLTFLVLMLINLIEGGSV